MSEITRELDTKTMAHTVGGGFDDVVLPHLDAALRLARWLARNEHDAEDIVQEASLRAFRYFHTFDGGNGRAWFLKIVRNTCRDWHGRSVQSPSDPFDEQQYVGGPLPPDPEVRLLQTDSVRLVERALAGLPDRFRQLLRLRELEGLSYQEMATTLSMPMGTVMSGLARARQAFREVLTGLI